MTNEVQFYTAAPQDVFQLATQGRVRILAYTEKQRHPLMPDVPTTQESTPAAGDYEARFWFALIGPGGMPVPLVNFINAEMLEFVRTPEVRERLASLGLKTYNSTPDDVRKEFATMAGQVEAVMARGIKLR
jgi:tripartite-type tricarboxylate transporter receptor subunit TctC